jgi:hypothetical protein
MFIYKYRCKFRTRGFLPKVKWPEREGHHSPTSADVKKTSILSGATFPLFACGYEYRYHPQRPATNLKRKISLLVAT